MTDRLPEKTLLTHCRRDSGRMEGDRFTQVRSRDESTLLFPHCPRSGGSSASFLTTIRTRPLNGGFQICLQKLCFFIWYQMSSNTYLLIRLIQNPQLKGRGLAMIKFKAAMTCASRSGQQGSPFPDTLIALYLMVEKFRLGPKHSKVA